MGYAESMFTDRSFRILLCLLIRTALPSPVPEATLKLDMTCCDIPRVFLAFFAPVAQCFNSALVVVFLLPYSVLPRNTKIGGFGVWFFSAGSGGELHFPGEESRWDAAKAGGSRPAKCL